MTFTTKTRRRWFGALCLLAAIAMLVADATLLKNRLTGVAMLAYWLGCFCFTTLAICVALLDMRAVRNETRAEQRALFESTLQNIKAEKSKHQTPNTK